MAQPKRSSHQGPFLRLGNTFFDPDPPVYDRLPEGALVPRDYLNVARALLEDRKRGRLGLFRELPDYLDRHRNGVLWRSVMLLYSLAMPERDIEALAKRFEHAVFTERDPFVIEKIFLLLLESGIPRLLLSSTRVLPLMKGSDRDDIARKYAIILEDIGFEPSASALVAAEATLPFEAFAERVAEEASATLRRLSDAGPIRIRSGRPIVLEAVMLDLAEALRSPYFFTRIYFEKVLLEAYTGFDLSSGFERLQLRQQRLYDALVRMADTVDLTRFPPGGRYFFGQPVEPAVA